MATRLQLGPQLRSLWARTNHYAAELGGRGFKSNTPDGWVTEGPVWWYGSDDPWAMGSGGTPPSGYAAVTKATSIIVNRLSSSDWSVDGTTPRWIADPMLCREDERYGYAVHRASLRLPGPLFWGQWIRSALLYGMGWMIYIPDAAGRPTPGTCAVLRADRVQVDRHTGNAQVYVAEGWRDLDRENGFTVGAYRWQLLALRNPTTPIDLETGFSVGTLQHHAAELGLVAAIANYAAGTYNGSGVPSGYLKSTSPEKLTQDQADDLKEKWNRAHSGGRRGVAVLGSTVEYSAIAVSPIDAALADMKRLSLVDVANAFCVPLFMLGAPTGQTGVYSNVMAEQDALWVHTLQPWAKVIEETLSALLPAGTGLMIALPASTTAIAQTMPDNFATPPSAPEEAPNAVP